MKSIPRDRVVVFRLSQEEYQSLKKACDSRGARNVSDFTRSEILAAIPEAGTAAGTVFQAGYLEQQIVSLQKSLVKMIQLLENVVRRDRAEMLPTAVTPEHKDSLKA